MATKVPCLLMVGLDTLCEIYIWPNKASNLAKCLVFVYMSCEWTFRGKKLDQAIQRHAAQHFNFVLTRVWQSLDIRLIENLWAYIEANLKECKFKHKKRTLDSSEKVLEFYDAPVIQEMLPTDLLCLIYQKENIFHVK